MTPTKKSSLLFSALGVLGVLAALFLPGAAYGQATGRLFSSGLTFTLSDLDPFDDNAPSLVFKQLPFVASPGEEPFRAELRNVYAVGDETVSVLLLGSGTTDLEHVFHPSENIYSSASLRGRDEVLTHVIEIEGAVGVDGVETIRVDADASTGAFEFVLSPNTAVDFYLDVEIDATVTNGSASREDFYIVQWLMAGAGPGLSLEFDESNISAFAPETPVTSISHVLNVTVNNRTNSPVDGRVWFQGGVHLISTPLPPAIPEPATFAMLVWGLFIVSLPLLRRGRVGSGPQRLQ